MIKMFISNSPEQTKQFAAEFTATLQGGEMICLRGELGSGKTTFVQGLAKALGYDGPVRSPTFTIVHVYATAHPTIRRLVHTDLYRLKHPNELGPLALEEYKDSKTVLVIEWPQMLLEKKWFKKILFDFESQTGRRRITQHSE